MNVFKKLAMLTFTIAKVFKRLALLIFNVSLVDF